MASTKFNYLNEGVARAASRPIKYRVSTACGGLYKDFVGTENELPKAIKHAKKWLRTNAYVPEEKRPITIMGVLHKFEDDKEQHITFDVLMRRGEKLK